MTTRHDAEGHHVIWADASELGRLRELHELPRTWATKDRLAELTKPKPRRAIGWVARLTPSRATPPRTWRALWLEHREVIAVVMLPLEAF